MFKWKVMPFGVANAPALFQELMNKILSILRRRPKVQELISRGAQMEAHIDDVCLGTNTQEDHLILLGEFFAVCQENHTRLKLEKCEFMQETMQYLGFDVGYGWWTPAASKAKPLMDAKVRHEDPKKGLHDVRSFIGACNFYRRHIKNFTYTSAVLTDLIKKSTTWRWGPQEQQAFDELKDKVANAKCLGVPRAQGEIILVTDASNVGGGGTLFQWQALEKEEFDSAISQWGTEGLNRDGTLKHSYPDDKWVLVPLGHWNWKWNQARGNYSTYEQELLAGMLVLSSQARSPHHAILTNHTCPEKGPLAVLCGDLHHHPKGTIYTIDLVGASITVVYVTLAQMRVLHHSGAHHTPFLQLPEWPQYRLFHQYLTQTARTAGHTLPGTTDMRTAYREITKQHPRPIPETPPYAPTGSKHEPVPPVTGPVPPLTLLLAPNEAKPTQTTVIHHGAKWRIPKHHMTARDLPKVPEDSQSMPRTCWA